MIVTYVAAPHQETFQSFKVCCNYTICFSRHPYSYIFAHVWASTWDGVIGMEWLNQKVDVVTFGETESACPAKKPDRFILPLTVFKCPSPHILAITVYYQSCFCFCFFAILTGDKESQKDISLSQWWDWAIFMSFRPLLKCPPC